jgi:hypothetical protein
LTTDSAVRFALGKTLRVPCDPPAQPRCPFGRAPNGAGIAEGIGGFGI